MKLKCKLDNTSLSNNHNETEMLISHLYLTPWDRSLYINVKCILTELQGALRTCSPGIQARLGLREGFPQGTAVYAEAQGISLLTPNPRSLPIPKHTRPSHPLPTFLPCSFCLGCCSLLQHSVWLTPHPLTPNSKPKTVMVRCSQSLLCTLLTLGYTWGGLCVYLVVSTTMLWAHSDPTHSPARGKLKRSLRNEERNDWIFFF